MIENDVNNNIVKMFQNFIHDLTQNINAKAVILFGSQARGTARPHSDYDILMIADFQDRFIHRAQKLIPWLPDLPLDLFCYTPIEFDTMFNSYRITAIDAIEEGKILFGEEYLRPYQEKLQDFHKHGMKKLECVLIPPQY
jgi:uncharacterized protein